MKRDLLFIAEKLTDLLEKSRLAMLARQHDIRQKRDDGGMAKTFVAFLRAPTRTPWAALWLSPPFCWRHGGAMARRCCAKQRRVQGGL